MSVEIKEHSLGKTALEMCASKSWPLIQYDVWRSPHCMKIYEVYKRYEAIRSDTKPTKCMIWCLSVCKNCTSQVRPNKISWHPCEMQSTSLHLQIWLSYEALNCQHVFSKMLVSKQSVYIQVWKLRQNVHWTRFLTMFLEPIFAHRPQIFSPAASREANTPRTPRKQKKKKTSPQRNPGHHPPQKKSNDHKQKSQQINTTKTSTEHKDNQTAKFNKEQLAKNNFYQFLPSTWKVQLTTAPQQRT